MAFDFDEIPYDWLEPGIHLEVRPNYATAGIFPYPVKPLLFGQKLPSGTLAAGRVVEVTRPEEGIALFGAGSIGAQMVAAFKRAAPTLPLFVMAQPDAAGAVKATGTFTFAGAVAAGVVLRFLLGGSQVRVTVTPADTPATLAAKLATAIGADPSLVVTTASAGAVVTVTSRHGGEVGNEIDIRVDEAAQPVPAGLTVTVAPMSGGSGNPLLQPLLDAIPSTWFTHWVSPWNDPTNMAALAADLAARYTALRKRDALGFVFKRGTYGELGAFGALTNCPQLVAGGLKRCPTASWVAAAAIAAVAAFQLTNDPARQLRSLALPGVLSPDPVDQFTDTEQDLLLRQGVSTFDCLPDGTVTVSRLVTTYKLSNLSVADRAWLDVMVPATMSRIRYDWAAYVSLLYPRAKLADDEAGAAFVGRAGLDDSDEDTGAAVVTPRRMHASWAGRCRLYADRVWIERIEDTVKQSRFARSSADRNRLESRQQVRIVGNLMVLAGRLEFQV